MTAWDVPQIEHLWAEWQSVAWTKPHLSSSSPIVAALISLHCCSLTALQLEATQTFWTWMDG